MRVRTPRWSPWRDRTPKWPPSADPVHSVTLYIGMKRGSRACAGFPKFYSFSGLRSCSQKDMASGALGVSGSTVRVGSGVYRYGNEPSASVMYFNEGLPGQELVGRTLRQANRLAAKWCQDAVYGEVKYASGRVETVVGAAGKVTPLGPSRMGDKGVRSPVGPACHVRAASKKELRHWFGIVTPSVKTTKPGW